MDTEDSCVLVKHKTKSKNHSLLCLTTFSQLYTCAWIMIMTSMDDSVFVSSFLNTCSSMKQNEKKKIFRFVVFNLKTAVVKRLISQYLEMKCVCLNHNDIYRVIKPD